MDLILLRLKRHVYFLCRKLKKSEQTLNEKKIYMKEYICENDGKKIIKL